LITAFYISLIPTNSFLLPWFPKNKFSIFCILEQNTLKCHDLRLLAVPEDLPRGLIFPISPLLDRPVKGDGLVRAIGSAAAAVPAFIRVQDDWGIIFFRVGDKDIYLADFHAVVAADTDIRIENYRTRRADNIW
jgi:hypothetical protein